MMKNYLKQYMKSDDVQISMLFSMINIVNDKNINEIKDLFDKRILIKLQFDKLNILTSKITKFLNENQSSVSDEQCKTLCDIVSETTSLLNKIRVSINLFEGLNDEINKIYNKFSSLETQSKTMSREEFLAFANAIKYEETDDESFQYPERAQESKLKKYGYSVAWDNSMSNKKRQELLKELIATGKVSKGYVISYLKHNIQINGKKESNEFAVSKWKEDLEFVYNL